MTRKNDHRTDCDGTRERRRTHNYRTTRRREHHPRKRKHASTTVCERGLFQTLFQRVSEARGGAWLDAKKKLRLDDLEAPSRKTRHAAR